MLAPCRGCTKTRQEVTACRTRWCTCEQRRSSEPQHGQCHHFCRWSAQNSYNRTNPCQALNPLDSAGNWRGFTGSRYSKEITGPWVSRLVVGRPHQTSQTSSNNLTLIQVYGQSGGQRVLERGQRCQDRPFHGRWAVSRTLYHGCTAYSLPLVCFVGKALTAKCLFADVMKKVNTVQFEELSQDAISAARQRRSRER